VSRRQKQQNPINQIISNGRVIPTCPIYHDKHTKIKLALNI